MRIHFLVCFAFLISIVLIDADTSPQRSTFQGVSDTGNLGRKLLRSSIVDDKGNTEERAGGVSVSDFDKFKSVLSNPGKLHLANWLESGKSVDTVFTRLHLHKGGSLFYKPQFSVWGILHARDLGTKSPEMSAISALTRQYGDEHLFNILETSKTNPRTELLATKLEIKQMQQGGAWKNIFDKPEFTTWTKYVDDLNTKYPEEPTWMYSTHKKYFNDVILFKLIYAVKWSEMCTFVEFA
ncbi:Avirulence (Avh) protein [Phytophthora megakarya]|uniref:Avirulence (Avh) protein n=1 Tax=Phytophthora megakarya TaxID=4795 RepID=A0A225VAE3_9STRA|nr:Avirulence (Avh) protein [Phytophthora megakarya]